MRSAAASAILLIVMLGAVPARAAPDCTKPRGIVFAKGNKIALRRGGILRAEDICYTVSGRAGQQLDLSVRSPDNNVVVAVYRPGYQVTPAGDGPTISGKTLPGAADQDEARAIRGTLPTTGRYLLVLGTTRGAGSDYILRIGIR